MTAATLPAEIEAAAINPQAIVAPVVRDLHREGQRLAIRNVEARVKAAKANGLRSVEVTFAEMAALWAAVADSERERAIQAAVDKLTAMGLAVSAQTVAKHMREARP